MESETLSPAKEDLELIVEIGRRIDVDFEEVRTWFERYRDRQGERPAFDFRLVRRFAKSGQ